ncbi:hypothetical protein BUALT_Bualt18G0088300 [Buddleja alternifolia]|uniref:Uncharacterized protein n=1 Tax=Buddleja alternifolia TaxID=168488 RepID=A0AAV6WD97_9LAMI|nr:hypothetical protein BUALT_Bualt18G0088300 [Buddleja alternifolia]
MELEPKPYLVEFWSLMSRDRSPCPTPVAPQGCHVHYLWPIYLIVGVTCRYARVPSQSIVIHMLSLLVRVWGKAGLGGAREPLAHILGRRTAGSSHVVSEPTLLRASHCGRRETPVWCSIKGTVFGENVWPLCMKVSGLVSKHNRGRIFGI